MFPTLRVPGESWVSGLSTGWETRFGVGEGREVGQGGGTSKVMPVDTSLSGMGNESLMRREWGSLSSPGKPEQPRDPSEPKESLERGLFGSGFGIWDEFPHGKSWRLRCPGAAPPSCFPPLPSSSLPKLGVNLTRKLPNVPCQSSTLPSSRIWPLELSSTPKTPQIQG